MTSAAASTGEDAAITPRRVKAWWPAAAFLVSATVMVVGGYFVFSGRFDRQELKMEFLEKSTDKSIQTLTDRLDKMTAAQEKAAEKNSEHLQGIEKALGKLEAIATMRLTTGMDGK